MRCVPRCWQWSHPDSPDRHDHRHDSAVAREKEETWVLASPVNPSASSSSRCLLWFPVCDTRRQTSRGASLEGDRGSSRLGPSATTTSRRRPPCPESMQSRTPEASLRDHTSLRLHMYAVESTKSGLAGAGAGAGAIDCCPEPSVHDWETGCEVTRLPGGTIRGSWAFPFRWTTFCWSARDFCSLLEDEGREKGRGQGPDGDFALLLRQILVELLPVGGERRWESQSARPQP